MIRRIVSGGQTGADRGGLDAAIALNVPHGGFCPRGRRAEDGVIPAKYQLIETRSTNYPERTERNVRESDGTLLVTRGPATGGSALTAKIAERTGRPLLHIDLLTALNPEDQVAQWLTANGIGVLNVAGPRESSCPGITGDVCALVGRILRNSLVTLGHVPASADSPTR